MTMHTFYHISQALGVEITLGNKITAKPKAGVVPLLRGLNLPFKLQLIASTRVGCKFMAFHVVGDLHLIAHIPNTTNQLTVYLMGCVPSTALVKFGALTTIKAQNPQALIEWVHSKSVARFTLVGDLWVASKPTDNKQ